MDEHPLISFADGPAGRRARLTGTGKDVWEVVAVVRDNDGSVRKAARYLEISLDLVQAAVTYYGAYTAEIDEQIDANEAETAEAHAAWVRAPREEPLAGGNVSTGVRRVGETVRRPGTAATPAVNAFLMHLQQSGFRYAPRFLGTDEQERQMLSWVPGRVQHDLGPVDLDGLGRVGSIIREFHDASASFVAPRDAQWQVAIVPDRAELIVHHDLAPWNLIVDGDAMTFIDWDGSGPGSRLWDLAYAAHGFAITDVDANPTIAGQRLAALVDGYRLGADERRLLVPMLAQRTRSMYALLLRGHRSGTQPWAQLYDEGHADHWGPVSDYLHAHESTWASALGV